MSIRVAAFTPVRVRWPHPLAEISRGIRIVEKPLFAQPNWSGLNFRQSEIRDALERGHWLCAESECEYTDRDGMLDRMRTMLRSALLGFQLWALIGWDGILIGAVAQDDGSWRVEGVKFPEPYPTSEWGKMLTINNLDPLHLGPLVEGTLKALDSGSAPVMNPFRFLELGLQTAFNHPIGAALFWTFGLDGLVGGAGGQSEFSKRLNKLLGANTLVFPEDCAGRRPTYTVGQVGDDLFAFRNQLAHGQIIPEKHRRPTEFKFEPPELAYLAVEQWTKTTLIVEGRCAVRPIGGVTEGHHLRVHGAVERLSHLGAMARLAHVILGGARRLHQASVRRCGMAEKCASLVASGRLCCLASAAIQRLLSGMGLPLWASSVLT